MHPNMSRVTLALLLLATAHPVHGNEAPEKHVATSRSSDAVTKDLQVFRPFVFGGLSLCGARYDVFAGEVGAGAHLEMKSLMFGADFGVENSKSSYSRTGHILQGGAFAAYRTSGGWYSFLKFRVVLRF
jgi:hypothetical protein